MNHSEQPFDEALLRFRIDTMEVNGYSLDSIFANISLYDSRFLNAEGLMKWRQYRMKAKQTGRIFALRNNPKNARTH